MTTVPSYAELARMPARVMAMGLALSWQAAQAPDHPALTMGDVHYSRIALDRAANRLARMLAGMDVEQGDKVVVMLPTGPMHQITSFALWKLGATVIPLSHKLVDHELEALVEAADPVLVIGAEPGRLPGRRSLPVDFPIDASLPDDPMPETVSPMWKAITSGGSTGMPKLLWEKRNSLIHPLQPMELLMVRANDVILHPATAYHNSPFCQTNWSLCWGSHIVLMEKFDAQAWLDQVALHRVRWAYLVPTMMSRILNLPQAARDAADLSSLEIVMHMAAPCPPWVKAGWIEWLGPEKIWEVYGGTEGFGSTLLAGTEWLAHPGTIGKAPPGTEVRGEDGNILPAGEVGTLYFLMAKDNFLSVPEGYHTYGDMGSMDADGYLYIADRRTDMIVSGGGNIYPAEIEAAMEQYPGVVAVAAIGLPHPDLGAAPHAIVELAPGVPEPAVQDIAAFLKAHLTRTKHPRTIEFTTASLRDGAGKMRRSRLRDERLALTENSFIAMQ